MTNAFATAKYKRHPDIRADILPDGYVLLQMKATDWVHILTPLGGIVWEFCDGQNTLNDIVARIAEIDAVEQNPKLKEQVAELLADFEKSQLVTSG